VIEVVVRFPLRRLPDLARLDQLGALIAHRRRPVRPGARLTRWFVVRTRLTLPRTLRTVVALVALPAFLPRALRPRSRCLEARAWRIGPRSARLVPRAVRPRAADAPGSVAPEAEAAARTGTSRTTRARMTAVAGAGVMALLMRASEAAGAARAATRLAIRRTVALPRTTRTSFRPELPRTTVTARTRRAAEVARPA
jgi:hypothetical protein